MRMAIPISCICCSPYTCPAADLAATAAAVAAADEGGVVVIVAVCGFVVAVSYLLSPYCLLPVCLVLLVSLFPKREYQSSIVDGEPGPCDAGGRRNDRSGVSNNPLTQRGLRPQRDAVSTPH